MSVEPKYIEHADKETIELMLDLARENLDAVSESRNKVSKKYVLYAAFCLGYIAFSLNTMNADTTPVYIMSFLLATSIVQLIIFALIVLINFKPSEESPKGFSPDSIWNETYFNMSYNFFIASTICGLKLKIDENYKDNERKALVLSRLIISNISISFIVTAVIFFSHYHF